MAFLFYQLQDVLLLILCTSLFHGNIAWEMMAQTRGSCQFVKKNNKLDAFLKRNLDVDTFHRVRAYDSCIVCSQKEDKAFKFVILTDEWFYLTENPPKKLYEAVHLRDIISIDLVNDFPNFLSGAEREDVQHLAIRYLTSEPRKGGKARAKNTARSLSVSSTGSDVTDGNTARSTTFTARTSSASPLSVRKQGKTGAGSVVQPYARQSLSARDTREMKVASARRSLASLSLNGGLTTRSSPALGQTPPSPHQQGSTPDATKSPAASLRLTDTQDFLKKVQFSSRLTIDSRRVGGESGRYGMGSSTVSLSKPMSPILKRKSSQTLTDTHDNDTRSTGKAPPPRPLPSPTGSTRSIGENEPRVSTKKKARRRVQSSRQLPAPSELKLDLSQLGNSEEDSGGFTDEEDDLEDDDDDDGSSVENYGQGKAPSRSAKPVPNGRRKAGPFSNCLLCSRTATYEALDEEDAVMATEEPGTLTHSDSLTLALALMSARSSLASEEADNEIREAVIHLYIMSGSSNIFMLAKTAWKNYQVRGTLEEDPRYVVKTLLLTPRSVQPASEKLELLFRQLKVELLHPANTMETIFDLVHELKVATERTFALKKLFWQSSEPFLFLVRQLHQYIPVSPCCTQAAATVTQLHIQRGDELDFAIHILQTLALMFRETEIMSSRTQILQGSSGRPTRDLLTVLACLPSLPVDRRQQHWTGDGSGTELNDMQDEYIRTAASVLFELLIVAEQVYWSSSNASTISVTWLVKQLDELDTTENFVEAIILDVFNMIAPNKTEEQMEPQIAILLYQELTILKTLIINSSKIIKFIRSNFFEEFKYFIQSSTVSKRLPNSYLIRPYVIETLDYVIDHVLKAERLDI